MLLWILDDYFIIGSIATKSESYSNYHVREALWLLRELINAGIKGRLLEPEFSIDIVQGDCRFKFSPDSLIGLLWYQLAQAVEGNEEFRQCDDCTTWFRVAPQVARKSRLYCSDACRSRAYRKRKAVNG